ncbi:MAG: phosphoesterase, partial [Chlamydiia bacterium]|nr:phosphoesterase [Chlamydiia bacterium]
MNGESTFKFEIEAATYNAQIDVTNRTLVIKDVTREDELFKQYSAGKLVLGEIEIDNFQQYQLTLSEEELFKVQAHVIKMLDELVIKHNIIYRQYTNGKYIIIANSHVLEKFKETKFSFLDALRKIEVMDGIHLSASLGFGLDSPMQKELLKMAKDGLLQSQARGGDQVTIISPSVKPVYYGSKSQIAKTVSKVKINKVSLLFEKKLQDERIKRVIVYGHKFADLDALGAALGIVAIAQAYGKEVYIQNKTYDSSTTRAIEEVLSKDEKKLFIKPVKARKLNKLNGTAVVIVDTAELSRIENPNALDGIERSSIFVFDHHRVSE